MPYINGEEKARLYNLVLAIETQIDDAVSMSPGNLNYLMTILAQAYVKRKGLTYTTLNDVIGVFESAKAEFQRRVVNSFEDSKIKDNGDVYE